MNGRLLQCGAALLMKASPLQLDRLFFTKVHFESVALELTALPKGGPLEYGLDCTVDYSQHTEEKNKFHVTLTVELKDGPEGQKSPFISEIVAVGYFSVTDALKPERWIEVAVANGGAVLFGAVRELVTILTARSRYKTLTLPAVNFIDEAISFQEEANRKQVSPDAPELLDEQAPPADA